MWDRKLCFTVLKFIIKGGGLGYRLQMNITEIDTPAVLVLEHQLFVCCSALIQCCTPCFSDIVVVQGH